MRVSVIVPTYKRPASLLRCLDALTRQDMAPDEVLVVARREDEFSLQVASERRADPIRLVLLDVPPACPGVVAALNAGVDISSGDVICLTDDDAEPRSDWISRIVAAFNRDQTIGAVGGRDWIHYNRGSEDGAAATVGTITPMGRLIGNHHLGVGPPRDVDVLKGVNLSVRGHLLRRVRVDERLIGVGTEHHWELALCLAVRRMGYRIVYDPAIAVEHRPQPRVDESRDFGPRELRDAAHNETLALLEYLPPVRRIAHLLWVTVIGSRAAPGLAQVARLFFSTGDPKLSLLGGNLAGRRLAALTYLRSRRSGVK
jgi:GT2 family glycosyltransferase